MGGVEDELSSSAYDFSANILMKLARSSSKQILAGDLILGAKSEMDVRMVYPKKAERLRRPERVPHMNT